MASNRPAAAAPWLEDLHHRVKSLARFPRMGRIVPELDKPDHREVVIAPDRVIYRLEPSRVYLLAVWHGRQELTPSALQDESP